MEEVNYFIAPPIKDFIFLGGVFGSLIFNYAMLVANSKSNSEKLNKLGKDVNATNNKVREMETKAGYFVTHEQGNSTYVSKALFELSQETMNKQFAEIKEMLTRLDDKISKQQG